MRQTLHIAMAVLATLGVSACGGLENTPFLLGTVRGQLEESDPSVAYVSVLGSPELRGTVAPDGSFTLEHVPAGAAELFIVASENKALRQSLLVQGGQSVTLGVLTPKEASFLSVQVNPPEHQSVQAAKVSVVGTPLQGLDADDLQSIGPLPDGCYALSVSLPGFPEATLETCVSAGEHKQVEVSLPAPRSSCEVTGCEDGFLCAQNGRCVECTEDSQCGPGLSCNNFRCENGPACTPCEADWRCRSNASCQAVVDGGKACLKRCENGNECEEGFTCQGGYCQPNPAQFSGCGAYRSVNASCANDGFCRGLGLVNGLCAAGTCTLPCAASKECPEEFSCADSPPYGRICVRDP